MKNFLMIAAIAVASLSAAGSKSYEITLNNATQAGKTELKAGHYTVKVNGAFAEFLNLDNSHSVMVPVKVETSNTKFGMTAVETKNESGVSSIESIELRDTNSKLAF
jgi:negative regulator of sigma E activity